MQLCTQCAHHRCLFPYHCATVTHWFFITRIHYFIFKIPMSFSGLSRVWDATDLSNFRSHKMKTCVLFSLAIFKNKHTYTEFLGKSKPNRYYHFLTSVLFRPENFLVKSTIHVLNFEWPIQVTVQFRAYLHSDFIHLQAMIHGFRLYLIPFSADKYIISFIMLVGFIVQSNTFL